MRFVQKALLCNRAEFTFGDKKLEVLIDDGRLIVGFSAAYHEIGTKRSIKSFPEKAVFRCAVAVLLGVVAGYALTGGDIPLSSVFIFAAFAFCGLILLAASAYAKFDATRIPVASGNTILIFHDDNHARILNEIYKRRRSELQRLHGEVDTLNHPQLELKKFLWLKEEGVLDDEAFDEARLKIAAISRTSAKFLS